MTLEINDHLFTLLPEKALYKHDERLLIIADVHLGKARHFRKEGLSIPADAQMGDYASLVRLFEKTDPLKVYFLGDLFHSTINRDWYHFCELVGQFPAIEFTLVRGNHDLINAKLFKTICVQVADIIADDAFVYSHDRQARVPKGKVNIIGHIHPGIVLSGVARQSIKLPCFYFEDNVLVLPAFGMLTGLYSMPRTAFSSVYIVLPDRVEQV